MCTTRVQSTNERTNDCPPPPKALTILSLPNQRTWPAPSSTFLWTEDMYKNMHKYLSPSSSLSLSTVGAPHCGATLLFTSQNWTERILGRTTSPSRAWRVNILCWNEESVISLCPWRTLRNFIVTLGLMNVLPLYSWDGLMKCSKGKEWKETGIDLRRLELHHV